jgi:flagellar biosynthesis protein FliP
VSEREGDDRRRRTARLVRFVTFVAMLDLVALALATQFVPPDRLTLAITVGPMLVMSPVLAYWFVYKRGRAVER